MKQQLLAILFIISYSLISAQNSINSGGGIIKNGSELTYSIGQVFYSEEINSKYQIQEGILINQNPTVIITTDSESISNYNITCYPNPTQGILKIHISGSDENNNTYVIIFTDINGKVIATQSISETENRIDLTEIGAGIYFLKILQENINIYTTKIIKN